MHRAYQPILPCGNKYLQQKWDKTYYDEHQRKVQTAKPMVDASAPPTYGHLNLKLKKLKLEEERLSIIERDNRLLLEKMSCIMRTKGGVDNRNDYESKSLNKEKRHQELLRVSRENQNILDRIEKCEPQYRVQKWHEDYQKAEKYMDSIAKYPRGWHSVQHEKPRAKGNNKAPKKEHSKEKLLKDEDRESGMERGEKGEPKKAMQKKGESHISDTEEARAEEKGLKKGKPAKTEEAKSKREQAEGQDLQKDQQPEAENAQSTMAKDEAREEKNEKPPKERRGEKETDEEEKGEPAKDQRTKTGHANDGKEEKGERDEQPKEEHAERETGGSEEVAETDQPSTAEDADNKLEDVQQEETKSKGSSRRSSESD